MSDVERSSAEVGIETAFLTTGLPDPVGMETARRMSAAVEERGAVARFVGILEGEPVVGLTDAQLENLAMAGAKLSARDLPIAIARGNSGGTTVAATLVLAWRAGLPVVATGGIGGVHRGHGGKDVSADLGELSSTPVVLVCSGAKAITDRAATLERLETLGVTIVGYHTDEFPAFWSRGSGMPIDSVDSAEEVARIWNASLNLGSKAAVLVCVDPPEEAALSQPEVELAVASALDDLETKGAKGPSVTPFLLDRIAEHTEGRSLEANVALLVHNAAVAARLARAVAEISAV